MMVTRAERRTLLPTGALVQFVLVCGDEGDDEAFQKMVFRVLNNFGYGVKCTHTMQRVRKSGRLSCMMRFEEVIPVMPPR
jgi:hypothetical protein